MAAQTVTSVVRRRRDGSLFAGTDRLFDGKSVGARNPAIGRELLDSRRVRDQAVYRQPSWGPFDSVV
jgi:hypothetical protein